MYMQKINLEALYAEHASEMQRISYYLTGDDDLAKECVQDTFIQLWRDQKSLANHPDLTGWLFRTLINRSKSKRRKHANLYKRLVQLNEAALNLMAEDVIDLLECQLDDRADIKAIYEQMGERDKPLFWHYFLSERSVKEAAHLQNRSFAATKSALQRIRNNARKKYGNKISVFAILLVCLVHWYSEGGTPWPK